MPTTVVHGRYTDEIVILRVLFGFFPMGPVSAMFDRSRWYCRTPRALTESQYDALVESIRQDHYAQDNTA